MKRMPGLLVLLVCCGVGGAWAEDGPAEPPPLLPEQAAELVLEALAKKDTATVADLGATARVDPWLVGHELWVRGEQQAAEAYAAAAQGPHASGLLAYLSARRDATDRRTLSTRMDAVLARMRKEGFAAALQILEGLTPPLDTIEAIRIETVRATLLEKVGRAKEAVQVHAKTAAAATELGWLERASYCWDHAGKIAFGLRNLEDALATLERRLPLLRKLGPPREVAILLANVAMVARRLHRPEQAVACLEEREALGRALGDIAIVADSANQLGLCYRTLGDYPRARAALERSLAASRESGTRIDVSRALVGLAVQDEREAAYRDALARYAEALRHAQAEADGAAMGIILGNMGNVLHKRGDLPEARAHLRRALAYADEHPDPAWRAITLTNLAVVEDMLGNHAATADLLDRAEPIARAANNKRALRLVLSNRAAERLRVADLDGALAPAIQAVALSRQLRDTSVIAHDLGVLGSLYALRGTPEKADAAVEESLAIMQRLGDRHGMAVLGANMAQAHRERGRLDKALRAAEIALRRLETLDEPILRADVQRLLASILIEQGRTAEALPLLQDTERVLRRRRAGSLLALGLGALAKAHVRAGEPRAGLAAARAGVREIEDLVGGLGEERAVEARGTYLEVFRSGVSAAAELGDAVQLGYFVESGRAGALLEVLGGSSALRWTQLPPELAEAQRNAREIAQRAHGVYDRALRAKRLAAAREAGAAYDDALQGLRRVAARIQREAKRQAGLFYPRAAPTDEIRRALRAGQTLVAYAVGLENVVALILTPEAERVVVIGPREEVATACAALELRDPTTQPAAALTRLRTLLIEPLGLAAGGTLLVCPTGPLCHVPFSLLVDGPVAFTPSGSTHVLSAHMPREPARGVLALGGADYAGVTPESTGPLLRRGRRLTPLPASLAEATQVGTSVLGGGGASEAALRAALETQPRWRALHIAGHGFVDDTRPSLSALALTRTGKDDGLLTAMEVLELRIEADLVVLSACDVGGDRVATGEGILGLSRAFMYAGAPRVLCSLWRVDDDATRVLMVKFYELWNPKEGRGLGAAAALEQAQAHVRTHAQWTHPYYWAAWVLWGLPV